MGGGLSLLAFRNRWVWGAFALGFCGDRRSSLFVMSSGEPFFLWHLTVLCSRSARRLFFRLDESFYLSTFNQICRTSGGASRGTWRLLGHRWNLVDRDEYLPDVGVSQMPSLSNRRILTNPMVVDGYAVVLKHDTTCRCRSCRSWVGSLRLAHLNHFSYQHITYLAGHISADRLSLSPSPLCHILILPELLYLYLPSRSVPQRPF